MDARVRQRQRMPSAPPPRRTRSAARSAGRSSRRGLPAAWLRVPPDQRQRLLRAGLVIVGVPAVIAVIGIIVLWVRYGRIIDSRLGGEQQPIPRIFARPFEIKAGDALSPTQLAQRLDDIGYARRPEPEQPGQFSVLANAILLIPRATDEQPARPIQIEFSKGPVPVVATMTVATLQGAAVPAKAAPETRSGSSRRDRPGRCSRRPRRRGPAGRPRARARRPRHARGAAARRARARREAALRAARQHPAVDDRRGHRHRGPAVLRAPRRRSDRRGRRAHHQPARRQALSGRRQHADAADRQEHVPHAGEDAAAQAAGAVHGARARVAVHRSTRFSSCT